MPREPHHGAKGLEWPVVILMDLNKDVPNRLWSTTVSSRKAISVSNPLKDRFIRYWPWPFGKQQSSSVSDAIALTPLAQAFQDAAIEESKRLLYVSMTRPRDLLILARSERKQTGEWLDALGAPWLLPDGDKSGLTLPSGRLIKGIRWTLASDEPGGKSAEKARKLYWFKDPAGSTARLPLVFNPSSATSPTCKVIEKIKIGERIGVSSGTDMAVLGTAVHACIATAFTDVNASLSVDEVSAILSGLGAGESVSSKGVLAQIHALQGWIAGKWGKPDAYAEIPVESMLDSGQIINGRIDLLLEVEGGWILLDHKASPQGADQWDRIAQDYAGQLSAYEGAVERATGKPVLESWLFFPVSAGAIRVDLMVQGGD